MYNKKVLDIFNKTDNAGLIKKADGVGKVGNAKCGDIMKLYLKIENNKIIDAKFKTFGCVAAIASTSVACDLIIGKTVDEALKIKNKDVLDVLGEMPANKVHCSVLAEEVIKDAIEDYYKRKVKDS